MCWYKAQNKQNNNNHYSLKGVPHKVRLFLLQLFSIVACYSIMEYPQPLLLFDGHCNLCARSVQFVLKHERKDSPIHFASLQSETGQSVKRQLGADAPDSLIFVHRGTVYTESTGFLVLCQHLKFPWSALQVFRFVPSFLRDPIYRWVARNRYKWMGKRETCWMPQPKWKSRFIH